MLPWTGKHRGYQDGYPHDSNYGDDSWKAIGPYHTQEALLTNVVVMPYRLGASLAFGSAATLPSPLQVVVPTGVNLMLTGWAANSLAGRNTMDGFGYLASFLAQAAMGYFLADMPGYPVNKARGV